VLVDVEGHGREEIAPGVDLSRTLGWFTSLYPVALDPGAASFEEVASGAVAAGRAVKAVKEQLAALPDHGIGYGMLAYLNPDAAASLAGLASPQIGFNYLGRFPAAGAAAVAGDGLSGGWAMAPEAFGGDVGIPAIAHALEVNSMVRDHPDGPRLEASWSWAGGLFTEAEVAELARCWFAALEGIVAHASRPGAGGHSPSVFSLINLTQAEIEELEALDRSRP
jgi:pristinamycin I synthase-2